MALWTVMIYLSGDNNLTEEMILALKELQRIEPNNHIKVLAQFDPSGLGVPTRRYDFSVSQLGRKEDGNLDRFVVDQVVQLDETNTGNPEALRDFIQWAAKTQEADNYFLILSGHGSGAEEDFLLKDESSLDSLTIAELQWALCEAKVPIRILGLDNCLMSTAEVISAISRHWQPEHGDPTCSGAAHVEYTIASQGFVPSQGWPYRRLLQTLLSNSKNYLNPKTTVAKVLELVVDGYGRFYSDYDFATGSSADLSAVEVKEIAQVGDSIKKLTTALSDGLTDQAFVDQLLLAHWSSQTYKFGQYVDLRHFCTLLGGRLRNAACDEVVEAVKHAVVRSCCTGPRVQYSYGISLYFPWAAIHESYQKVSMPESGWYDFLLEYLKETRQPNRHESGRYSTHRPLAVPPTQERNVREVFRKRKRPDLARSLGLGYLQAAGVPSSYAEDREVGVLIKTKHAIDRYQSGALDLQPVTRWIQNPATGSGATCYARDEKGGREFSLPRV